MKPMMSFVKILIVVVFLVATGTVLVNYWSFIFAKTVKGEIVNVERVTDPSAIISSRATPEQLYSYSVLIQGEDGKLYTSSSEDRQWQVAKKGYCVKARLYIYPPWDLEKGNTYFNARLLELSVCPGKPAPSDVPAASEPTTPPAAPSETPATDVK